MKTRTPGRVLVALLLALSLLAASCGDSDDEGSGEEGKSDLAQPGEGKEITLARANWSTGYMQAAIYQQLLGELGYEVSDPSTNEMDPATFFPAVAEGEVDAWVNTWTPIHDTQFIDGNPEIEDKVTSLGEEMQQGALQGILIDKATADEHDITTIDQIAEDPELAKLFDVDGDDIADVYGCDEGWGCEKTLTEWFAARDWTGKTVNQLSGTYSAVFTEASSRIADGEPTLVYTWTPSAYVSELLPGDNVVWLGTDAPLDEQKGAANLTAETCPAQPCEMGFVAADIRVTVNNDFLAENPAAGKLFELVKLNVIDVAKENVQYDGGEDSEADVSRHASEWIEENREDVDAWLEEASKA